MTELQTKSGMQPSDVAAFVGRGEAYYTAAFTRIETSRGWVPSFNAAAAALGPLWAGARGLWGLFWGAILAEALALTQIGRGLFGSLGAEEFSRARRLQEASLARLHEARAALQAGNQAQADTAQRVASNLHHAAEASLATAQAAAAGASRLLIAGCGLLLISRLVQGLIANHAYARRYAAWRSDKSVPSGLRRDNVLLAVLLVIAILPLTVYGFTATHPPDALVNVPIGRVWFGAASGWLNGVFDAAYAAAGGAFDGIRDTIRTIVDGLEMVLLRTPWPVVMVSAIAIAWRLAGPRTAVFTAASIAYLACLGMWQLAMQTVALLGASAALCIALGIPIGIWLARSGTAFRVAQPVLDLMQTMPAFVYLIPVIAFFGTGKPPAVLATIIFGMPPVVRLTTLGLRQVPEDVKEAARAFGATRWQLLTSVELPLAAPSIMTGINQTILMSLSMVVIAALIGAEGLGSVVLQALEYAAKGEGILAGVAILLCAMVIDRLAQGKFRRTK